MRIRGNVLKKFVSIFSSLLLILNSFSPFLLIAPTVVNPVKAQEVTATPSPEISPTDTVTPTTEVTPTDSPTPTVEATPTATVTPDQTLTPAADATVTPTVEVTPSIDVSPVETITPADQPSLTPTEAPSVTSPPSDNNQSANQSSSTQPSATPTPSPVQSLKTNGSVNSTIVDSFTCRADSLNGCLVTDKADYAPTEVAVVTGNGFKALTEYTLKITSDNLEVSYQITTDLNGSFTYSYQLDGTYRPTYFVQAFDLSGNLVAATTFLDHNNHPTETPTPSPTPTKPDLTAVKTNDVSGNAVLNTPYNWNIKIQNNGQLDATFNKNETVFTDYLPTIGATYGSPTVNQSQLTGNGQVSCSIDHSTKILTCTAEGNHSNDKVTIPGGKYFTVSFSVTPTSVGTLNNPRDPINNKDNHDNHDKHDDQDKKDNPICMVDPNDKVDESNENNNTCSDSVQVSDQSKTSSFTIIKDAQPDSTQSFDFTTSNLGDFKLADDPNNANNYPKSKTFSNVAEGVYAITEQPTDGWYLYSIDCTDLDDVSINGNVLTLTLKDEGPDDEPLVCTFVNKVVEETPTVTPTVTPTETPTPTPGPAELDISKTNNASGEKNTGDLVTYTLTLTDLFNNLTNVVLKDLLPKGFVFQNVVSIIKNGSTDITSQVGDPHYHSPGTYNLGNMNTNDVIVITYTAQIDGSVQPGDYKDLAWATGTDGSSNRVLALAQPAGFVDTNYSGTDVSVGGVLTNTGNINIASQNGQVLGASTSNLPATGADNQSLILALILSVAGLLTMMTGYFLNNKKNLKFLKKTLSFLLMLFAFAVIAGKTQAAGNLSIRLSQPKSPTAVNNFSLTFVVLDSSSSPANITVQCFKKGPNDGGFSQFAGDVNLSAGGNTDSCSVGGVMGDNGTYQFYATANNGSETVTSSTTSVNYNTTNTPNTPFNYSKTFNNCQYTISFTTANDNVTSRVEIYRSKNTSFNLDSSTRITSLNVSPNQNVVYTDNSPDCTQTWYYVVRAFNNLGVGSGTVGDSVTTTNTTTTTTNSTTPAGAIPVSNSNVLGIASASAGQGGQVIGAEASGTPEVINVNQQGATGSVKGAFNFVKTHKKITLLVILLAAIMIGGVIWLKKRK